MEMTDPQQEVIQRLTRVEEQIAQLVRGFEKLERRLIGESGANGLIGALTIRVTALEGAAQAMKASGLTMGKLLSVGGWIAAACWAVFTHFQSKGGK